MSPSSHNDTVAVVPDPDEPSPAPSAGPLSSPDAGADSPRPQADSACAGLRIGRYEVLSQLGRGGMGSVYRAFDPVLEREVALKVMLPGMVGDAEMKQRFEREARAVARLSHPAVLTVFDLGYHTDGSPYIVMELLRGRDLLARMRDPSPFPLAEKLAIVGQILDGLGHAHKAGIVHRDVKPANVFLTEDGAARIMDFGLAFFTSSGATSRTIMGTVAYMSTEQVRGERLDGRSDLFSVGTLLCELLTGKRPFDAENPGGTLFRIASEEPLVEIPAGEERSRFLPVIRKALARRREDRYQTAADFSADLRAGLDPERGAAAPAAAPPVAAPPAAAAQPVVAPPPVHAARPIEAPPAATPVCGPPRRAADPGRLFQILRDAYVGGKTGQLHLACGGHRKGLRILKGRLLHGTSDANGEHLGDVLVRYGLLAQADLDRAVGAVLRERRRLGTVLREMGLIEPDALAEAIGIHVREILFSALDEADAVFSFEELSEDSFDADVACPQSMGQVILEATRRVFDPALVRRLIGDTSRVLTLSPDPMLRTQKITLTPTDGFVLSRVDGTLSAREIVDLITLPEEDTERSLFSLLCTGVVSFREAAPARRTAARPEAAPSAPPSAPPPRPTPPPTSPRPTPATTAAPAAPPPQATPPPPPASPPSQGVAFTVAETRALLEASRQPRRDPFEVLGVDATADESRIRLAYARLARVLHPDAPLDPSLEDLRGLRQAAFVQLGQAVETLRSPGFRQFAAEKAARAWSASTAPTPAPVPEPPTTAPAPSAPPPAASERAPQEVLHLAQRHFDAGEFWDAIQLLEPLYEKAEGPARALGGTLLAQAYLKNPKWRKRAEQVLLDVVQRAPKHLPAHLALADVYRAGGMQSRARSFYQKVLALQPDHEAAANALAELEPPPQAPAPGRIGGLFRRH